MRKRTQSARSAGVAPPGQCHVSAETPGRGDHRERQHLVEQQAPRSLRSKSTHTDSHLQPTS